MHAAKTISEDLAYGQRAHLDSYLRLLHFQDISLLAPEDDSNSDIHLIETPGVAQLSATRRTIKDIEKKSQYTLHNMENRSRVFPHFPPPPPPPGMMLHQQCEDFDHDLAIKEVKRRQRQAAIQDVRAHNSHYVLFVESTTNDETPSSTLDVRSLISNVSRAKKRKHDQTFQAQPHQSKINIHSTLHPIMLGLEQTLAPNISILYRVHCQARNGDGHTANLYRDLPFFSEPASKYSALLERKDEIVLHLNGHHAVHNFRAFMEEENDEVDFVVLRTIECSLGSALTARKERFLRWTEEIYTKSKTSKTLMQQTTTCYFQPKFQTQSLSDPMSSGYQNRVHPADQFLFHHAQSFEAYAAKSTSAESCVRSLSMYMDQRFSVEFSEAKEMFHRGLVTQETILYLFKPNDFVISRTLGKPAIFVLQEWPTSNHDGRVILTCWSFHNDGSGFARKRCVLTIPPLENKTIEIQNLAAYPLEYASKTQKDLIRKRGEKQWSLRNATQISYSGWNVSKDQFFPDSRFMIDHKTYRKMHKDALAFQFERLTTPYPYDFMPTYLNVDQEPTDLEYMLMPPDTYGFYLNEKKWFRLFVDCVQPVTWNKKAFERLVLPRQTKDLVQALVSVRAAQRGVKQGLGVAGRRTDIINGKGNGLIMLLHGGPGTGKTLTGESVAEIAEMPLYRVTCGDIGTNAGAVENYLNVVLHLGHTWNCVLLLDEADVFLEERSMADLERNSLVSVFLRILEYYDGILILTSNRVGMFDEAFKSRIQVALHYENLNRATRKKIWQNFLDMLEEDDEDVNFDEIKLHLDELAGKELNGRQIRNVLTTARQLAIFRQERLVWRHLEQALGVSSDFTDYLKTMQGHTDDQRARDIKIR